MSVAARLAAITRRPRWTPIRRWFAGRIEALTLGAGMALVVFALEHQLKRTLARRQ